MNDGHPGRSTAFLGANLYSLTIWLAVFLLPFFLLACDSQKKESYTPVYASMPAGKQVLIFGVLPFYNPQRLHETFGPLVEYLSRNLPDITITMEASRSYDEFEKKLASRHFDFALLNILTRPSTPCSSATTSLPRWEKTTSFAVSSSSERTAASTELPT